MTRAEQEGERQRLTVEALALYESGLTCGEVGDQLGLSSATIQNYLRPLVVSFRRALLEYRELPADVLSVEWALSEAGAWVCGLVVTDGHLRTLRPDSPTPNLKITLARKDRDGVVAAAQAFGLPGPAVRDHVQSGLPVSTVEFSHPRLWFLHRDLGMPLGHKITTAKLPPQLAGSRHAWRGVLDGDGWSSLQKPPSSGLPTAALGLTGSSLPLHRQYQAYLDSLPVPWGFYGQGKVRSTHRQPCPETIVNAEPAARLAELLYTDCEYTIARKRAAALRVRDARLGRPGRAPRRPRVTPEEVTQMVTAYQAGEVVAHIAARMGKSAVTVAEHLRRQGVLSPANRRRSGTTPE